MTISLARIRRGLALCACALTLVACGDIGGTRPTAPEAHVPLVAATNQATGVEVITPREDVSHLRRFFSPQNLRETVFSGDANPRLAGSDGREGTGYLDLRRVNEGLDGQRQGRGEFFIDVAGEEVFIEPLPRQQILGGQWQAPGRVGGNVDLNFDNTPLTQVIREVMGGILGVNYIIGDTVTGTLTFRSERRFSSAELLQAMADILARRGFEMQFFNGIYHIGEPAEMESLTGLRARAELESDATHLIRMRRDAPQNLIDVVNTLIPPGNVVAQAEGANTIIVRGDPSQFASIEELVRSLVESRPNVQALAIVPVRRSPPETIAEQVTAVFGQRGLGDVLLIPVETVPGVLVVAETRQTVSQVTNLITQLDVENRDRAQVRIIQLSHLNATDLAARLGEVLGDAALVPEQGAAPDPEASAIISAAVEQANEGEAVRPANTTDGLRAPRFIRRTDAAPPVQEARPQPTTRAAMPAQAGEGITFSADTRNNTLLVRSNFQEFQRIQEVVRALDVPLAQVVIEATIIEVDINDQLQYGVQFYLERFGLTVRSSDGTGAPVDPGGGGFAGTWNAVRGDTTIQAVVTALQSVTNVRVISSPYLTVVDGATSRLNVGDQIPFVIASQTSQSGGQVTVTQEIETRDIGVILSVTPRISPNNAVLLEIEQEVSSARVAETVAGANPIVSQRRVQSQIVVQSGGTVLLGGLIQERTDTGESGVPVLRRIPGLGELFNRTDNTQARSELLILITPRVVRNANALDDLTRTLRLHVARR